MPNSPFVTVFDVVRKKVLSLAVSATGAGKLEEISQAFVEVDLLIVITNCYCRWKFVSSIISTNYRQLISAKLLLRLTHQLLSPIIITNCYHQLLSPFIISQAFVEVISPIVITNYYCRLLSSIITNFYQPAFIVSPVIIILIHTSHTY